MRIHGICVAKNEADVIGHCFERALSSWADAIYVMDNGSSDETWDIVRTFPKDRVIPWKQEGGPFRDSLRGQVFNAFRERASTGDWWCRLDADEFFVESPRVVLSAVPRRHHVVWATMIHYFLTEVELEQIDFDQPIAALLPLLRRYDANFSEARFFRHRSRLVWPDDCSWPRNVGVVHPERILMRHYKYRSPEQIRRRLDTRRQAIQGGTRNSGGGRFRTIGRMQSRIPRP
jgi:glycosyltransferase involved in cell wall biosynthesis